MNKALRWLRLIARTVSDARLRTLAGYVDMNAAGWWSAFLHGFSGSVVFSSDGSTMPRTFSDSSNSHPSLFC